MESHALVPRQLCILDLAHSNKFDDYRRVGRNDKMTFQALFIFSLIFSLLRLSWQLNDDHLIELILSWEDSTCPGTVVVFDKHYWMEEHTLIDQMVLRYPRPLTLLQSFSKYGLMPEEDSWSGGTGSAYEPLCNNVIVFNRYPPDLTPLYRQLTARYPYIGQVLVVTQSASEQIDRFLFEFRNHKILLLLNRPWRHLELRSCCWGPERQIRRVDIQPDSMVHWEEFGLRTSRLENSVENNNQLSGSAE